MRRALLTAPPAAVPISIGNPAVFGSATISGNRLMVDAATPATASGTLTSVSVYASTAGTLHVMTGTISGTNYTVRAITAALTFASGVNTLTISLPVAAGDFLALYSPSTGGATVRYSGGSGTMGYSSSPASPPTAGNVLAFSTLAALLSAGATG